MGCDSVSAKPLLHPPESLNLAAPLDPELTIRVWPPLVDVALSLHPKP